MKTYWVYLEVVKTCIVVLGHKIYEEFEHAFSHLSKHIKSFLVDQEACDPKKDLRVKDVREYLKLVLDEDDLDPPINRKGTLVDAWDNHYAPLLRELGEMD